MEKESKKTNIIKNIFYKIKSKKWWIISILGAIFIVYFLLKLFDIIPGEPAKGKYLPKVPKKKSSKIINIVNFIPTTISNIYAKIKQRQREKLKDKLNILQKQLKQKEQQLNKKEETIKQTEKNSTESQQFLNKEKIWLTEQKQKLLQEKKDFEAKLANEKKDEQNVKVSIKKSKKAKEKNITQIVSVYENMKPSSAAKIIEGLDESFAIEILQKMDEEQAAKILAKMEVKKAASLTKKISLMK